eukprot:jgi/Botrbrau1/11351/Bobra.0038s0107.2
MVGIRLAIRRVCSNLLFKGLTLTESTASTVTTLKVPVPGNNYNHLKLGNFSGFAVGSHRTFVTPAPSVTIPALPRSLDRWNSKLSVRSLICAAASSYHIQTSGLRPLGRPTLVDVCQRSLVEQVPPQLQAMQMRTLKLKPKFRGCKLKVYSSFREKFKTTGTGIIVYRKPGHRLFRAAFDSSSEDYVE